jgi:hypothetical protein
MIRPRLLFLILILCLALTTLVGQVKTGADLLFEKHFLSSSKEKGWAW